jgi:hypothetical protein
MTTNAISMYRYLQQEVTFFTRVMLWRYTTMVTIIYCVYNIANLRTFLFVNDKASTVFSRMLQLLMGTMTFQREGSHQ